GGGGVGRGVLRWGGRVGWGSGLPWYLSSSGLGSKVSTCEGPPFRKRWTTRCAFAGKCGGRGASGFVSAGAARAEEGSRPSSASKPVSPNRPKPSPLRRSNSRRGGGRRTGA